MKLCAFLKSLLDCNEMLLANFLPTVQKKLLNSSHLSVTLQLLHNSLIWEPVFPTLDVFPDAGSNFRRISHIFRVTLVVLQFRFKVGTFRHSFYFSKLVGVSFEKQFLTCITIQKMGFKHKILLLN